MSDKIEFHKNNVQVTLGDQNQTVSFEEITQVLSKPSPLLPLVLPQSVKYHAHEYRNDTTYDLFVLEEKPKVVPIKWKMRKADKEYAYEGKPPIMRNSWSILPISVPYVVFIVQIINGYLQRSYAYFRREPLETIDDYLFQAPLLNVHRYDSSICLGDFAEEITKELDGIPYSEKIPTIIRKFHQHFWGSTFNYEHGYTHKKVDAINPAAKWSESSAKNPNFGLEVDWIPAGTTPRQVMDSAGTYYSTRTTWQPHFITPRILALSNGQK
jgi:hypothetical protein